MFDLDHFNLINDNYGHQCGDVVLIKISQLVQSLLRHCDLFGRYGGEEFAIILPETDLIGAKDVAMRIRQAIDETVIKFHNENIRISASVGVTTIDAKDKRYEDMINNADVALYRAKDAGRNLVCTANEAEECFS